MPNKRQIPAQRYWAIQPRTTASDYLSLEVERSPSPEIVYMGASDTQIVEARSRIRVATTALDSALESLQHIRDEDRPPVESQQQPLPMLINLPKPVSSHMHEPHISDELKEQLQASDRQKAKLVQEHQNLIEHQQTLIATRDHAKMVERKAALRMINEELLKFSYQGLRQLTRHARSGDFIQTHHRLAQTVVLEQDQ